MPQIGAAAVGGGLGLLGAFLGSRTTPIQKQQMNISQQMWGMAQPSLNAAQDYYTKLLSGDPSATMQAIGPGLQNANLGFNAASQNLINSSYARGGGLTAGLAGLEGQRATTLGGLVGEAQQSAPSALAALGQGLGSQALQALAGAQQTGFQNAYTQQQAFTGIGSFLTRLISGMSTGGGNQSQMSSFGPYASGYQSGPGTSAQYFPVSSAVPSPYPNLGNPPANLQYYPGG